MKMTVNKLIALLQNIAAYGHGEKDIWMYDADGHTSEIVRGVATYKNLVNLHHQKELQEWHKSN